MNHGSVNLMPERQVARDMVRRGLIVSPVALLVGLVGWQVAGVASVAAALVIVLVNFLLAAGIVTAAAKVSPAILMGASMFGYVLRLLLIFLAFVLIRDLSWFRAFPFGFTIIVAHLGLLVWELRHVSASLAFPGLKPGTATPRTHL